MDLQDLRYLLIGFMFGIAYAGFSILWLLKMGSKREQNTGKGKDSGTEKS